jgi:hypothetical protein
MVGGLASRVVRQMSRAPTARGVVAHGAAFSKHFAAFTLEDATDVILAAKDGWGVEGLAEACDAVLAAGRAGDGDGGEVEVEILASTSETLEDDLEPEGAACVHPTEFRARRRREDVASTSDAWDPWRAFRAEAPREDRVDGGADGGVPTPRPPRKNRNARKNENRASAFAALLVRAFGLETLRAGAGVVDVAGGSGELALELVTRWAVPCCVVDPRGDGAKITARHRRLLASRERNAALVSDAWKAESALARSLARRWTAVPDPHRAIRHLKRAFDERIVAAASPSSEAADADAGPDGAALMRTCSAIVGMHPDQAAGAIVDAALRFNKPFAVVPCCVFPNRFPERTVPGGDEPSKPGEARGTLVRVRTTEALARHLARRPTLATRTRTARVEALPMDGANLAVWCAASDEGEVVAEGTRDFPWPEAPKEDQGKPRQTAPGPFRL